MSEATLRFRVEHVEYAEIVVDVPALIAEWGDTETGSWDRDDVIEVLHRIGVRDLMYSGDFIKVLDKDEEDEIR